MTISQSVCSSIASAAINAQFAKKIEVEKARESALAEKCWTAVFPKAERDAALAMPDTWLRRDKCLRFNAGGWDVRLDHLVGLPVPAGERLYCHRLGTIDGQLAEKVQAFIKERDAFKQVLEDAKRNIIASIYAARGFKKLAEIWPEGKEYYAEYLSTEEKRGSALAVPFAEINKTLGLAKAA